MNQKNASLWIEQCKSSVKKRMQVIDKKHTFCPIYIDNFLLLIWRKQSASSAALYFNLTHTLFYILNGWPKKCKLSSKKIQVIGLKIEFSNQNMGISNQKLQAIDQKIQAINQEEARNRLKKYKSWTRKMQAFE